MSDKKKIVPFYTIRNHHKEIIGRDDPCSIYELLFWVEAPEFISGLDIWKYAERMDLDDLIFEEDKDKFVKSLQISKGQRGIFPFYELFTEIFHGTLRCPLIFQEGVKPGKLFCIEGRHRFRILCLFRKYGEKFFKNINDKIPVIIVRAEGEKPKRFPERYDLWEEWLSDNNIVTESRRMRKIFDEFLQKE